MSSVKTQYEFIHHKCRNILFYKITIVNFGLSVIPLVGGWLINFWSAFCNIHDILNISIKFDNNWCGNFEDYQSNKKKHRRWRVRRQRDGTGRPNFSYSRRHETSRKHASSKLLDRLDYYTCDCIISESNSKSWNLRLDFSNCMLLLLKTHISSLAGCKPTWILILRRFWHVSNAITDRNVL